MANTFNNSLTSNIGLDETIVYQTLETQKATVIGINLANLLTTSVEVNIVLEKVSGSPPLEDITRTFIVKNVFIPKGNSLAAIGGDQKLVMTGNNRIKVSASEIGAVDVIVSVLEIT